MNIKLNRSEFTAEFKLEMIRLVEAGLCTFLQLKTAAFNLGLCLPDAI
jgi:hypothetical protein